MTTNQTIDGVPRELLERVATEANHMLGFTYASNCDECRAAVDELRALLDSEQPALVTVTLSHVLAAYDYANCHPHKYLRGTTNWCAAVAYKLNACLDEVTRLNAKS